MKPKKYFKKPIKHGIHFNDLIEMYPEHESKLMSLLQARLNGFTLYNRKQLLKMLLAKDIEDYVSQFIKLHEYNQTHNKYANTLEKYQLNYGKKLGEEKFKYKSERVLVEKNPAYQHGGKYTPLSDKFVGKTNKEEVIAKISKSNKENGNNDCTLVYWTKRGFTEEEAKEKISKRQSTFSLKKCIQRYGEVEGYNVWKHRQEKWQNTLNNKTKHEIDDINFRKGTGNMNRLFSSDPHMKEIPGILYYIRFYNNDIEFWKIGITSRSVNERFSNKRHNLSMDIIFEKQDTFYNCYKMEQEILRKNKEYRTRINYNGFQTTEAFNRNIHENI